MRGEEVGSAGVESSQVCVSVLCRCVSFDEAEGGSIVGGVLCRAS